MVLRTLLNHADLILSVLSVQKALITGVTGQDESCLAELLLKDGYEVNGITRHFEG
jgi:hypothetical protein